MLAFFFFNSCAKYNEHFQISEINVSLLFLLFQSFIVAVNYTAFVPLKCRELEAVDVMFRVFGACCERARSCPTNNVTICRISVASDQSLCYHICEFPHLN